MFMLARMLILIQWSMMTLSSKILTLNSLRNKKKANLMLQFQKEIDSVKTKDPSLVEALRIMFISKIMICKMLK